MLRARFGKVENLLDDGRVSFTFLDSLGGGVTNYLTMPYVSRDFGMLVVPKVGDVIILLEEPEANFIIPIGYIPQNYDDLPVKVSAGEYLFLNGKKAYLYLTKDGSVLLKDNIGQGLEILSDGRVEFSSMDFEGSFGEYDVYIGDIKRLGVEYDGQEIRILREGVIELCVSENVIDSDGKERKVDDVVYLYLKIGDAFEMFIDKTGKFKIMGSMVTIGDNVDSLLKVSFVDKVNELIKSFNFHTHYDSTGHVTTGPTPLISPIDKNNYKTNKLESE